MRRIDHNAIDNSVVEVCPLEFLVNFNSAYVPDPDTTTVKSIDDDEVDPFL